jgi:serine/threonine protein kinase
MSENSLLGKVILNYKIIKLIGSGGMADVFLAEHTNLGNFVAIKRLWPQFAKNEMIVKKFEEEAKKLATLQNELVHANIVYVQNFHKDEDGLFIVMEYFKGEDLSQYLSSLKEPMDPLDVRNIIKQILEAFVHVHKLGIVHKDIKPSNILINNHKRIKIVDFGISEIIQDSDYSKTKNQTMGTLPYMSPEQIRNKNIGFHSDIYSVGMVYYEMLIGGSPYNNLDSTYDISHKIINENLIPVHEILGNDYIADWRVIEKSIRKDPADRYQSCDEFLTALKNITLIFPDPVYGCTNPKASNYNPKATFDDGSCVFNVNGCTDSKAINYNSQATIDDGSCLYQVYGCMDPKAKNYNPRATISDGSCRYETKKLISKQFIYGIIGTVGIIGIIIAVLYIKKPPGPDLPYATKQEVKDSVNIKCEKELDWKGAEEYLEKQIDENPNCKDDQELKDRLKRLKEINDLDLPELKND